MPSSNGRHRSRGRWWPGVFWLVLSLIAVGVGLYAAFPWLVAQAAPRLTGPLGLDTLRIAAARPGLDALRITEIAFTAGRLRVTARGVTARYELADLLDGRLAALVVDVAEVSVDPPLAAVTDAPDAGALPVPPPPPDPAGILAALPVDRMHVARLDLAVPALGFFARGGLDVDEGGLEGRLRGLAPAAAERLLLEVRLDRGGDAALQLLEQGRESTPLLALTAAVAGSQLGMDGQVDLSGFAFDLAAAIAGLPRGEGEVGGRFAGKVPWPPAVDAWLLRADGAGTLGGRWLPAGRPWGLPAAELSWRWSAGRLEAEGHGEALIDGAAAAWHVTARDVDPVTPSGTGTWRLAGATSEPMLDLAWQLAPEGISVAGGYRLDGAALTLLYSERPQEAGDGLLSGRLQGRLAPLPGDGGASRLALEGNAAGHWALAEITLGRLDGQWRVDGDAVAAEVRGELERHGLALPLAVNVAARPRGDRWTAEGQVALSAGVTVPFTLHHEMATGNGDVAFNGKVEVRRPLLADLFRDWQQPFDVTAGRVGLDARVTWRGGIGGAGGRARLEIVDLDGRFGEIRLAGLTGDLELTGDGNATDEATGGWALAPTTLHARRLDTGVEIHELTADLAGSDAIVTVTAPRAWLLGGAARADGFTYHVDSGAADVLVTLDALALDRVLALEGGHVSGTGTIHGRLPISLRHNRPSIRGGELWSAPPGGVIRVAPALASGAGQPGLDFALRALADFRYDTLEADVDYSVAGDLALAVRLQGRNPEIEGGRPIHYNVNVSENVPTLLRSLRLQDEVTREIERQVQH